MSKIRRVLVALLMAALLAFVAMPFAACEENVARLSFLKVEGELIKNENGEDVSLRGVNAGGLGVIEQWMTGFVRSSSEDSAYIARDHYTTSQVWIERFGYEDAVELWKAYQEAWWTEDDFANCAKMGINVIRLPFTYMDIDFDAVISYKNAGDFDFTFLDNFVSKAEEYGIYTILDLHGAYGSQNGQDHSGQTFDTVKEVTFYSDENLLQLTADLWGAVAEHFKDNPAVAGYDLLNEPIEKGNGETSKRHWDALDMFYKAIRAVGDEHIVIFESCWGGSGLPQPEVYGWENCMYSFHHYTGCSGDDRYAEHCKSFSSRLNEVKAKDFGVPLYMGEFTCYTNEEQWEYTLDLLNKEGWHWTSWTYKIWGSSGWGIYNIQTRGQSKINAHDDGIYEIYDKFKAVLTESNAVPFTFESGKTLFEVIKSYCIIEEDGELSPELD